MHRESDMAVFNTVSLYLYDINGPEDHKYRFVPKILSTPNRAFALLNKVYERRNIKKIPLPFVSLYRDAPEFDQSRYTHAWPRHLRFTSDKNAIAQTQSPKPYNIPYQLDIWGKTRLEVDHLVEQYLADFSSGNFRVLDIVVGTEPNVFGASHTVGGVEPLLKGSGVQNDETVPHKVLKAPVELWIDSITENSELEPGTGESNIKIRKTINLTLKSWLVHDFTYVPTVQEVLVKYVDMNSNEVIESFTLDLVYPDRIPERAFDDSFSLAFG